jgi:hypothetical protein
MMRWARMQVRSDSGQVVYYNGSTCLTRPSRLL